MESVGARRHRLWVTVAAVALTAWGVFGFIQRMGTGYTGALFHSDYTIPYVEPEGPLAEAGFQVGDSVVSVEGIPVERLGMYSRWPGSLSRRPGESLEMTVERDGDLVSGRVVFRERPSGVVMMQLGGMVIGLSFLWFGVWALLAIQNYHALRLAYIGLAAGAAVGGPDLGSWNGVLGHVQLAAMVLWLLLIARFFLLFPKPKRLGEGRVARQIMFGAWVVLLLCLVLELIFHPRFYHTFGPLYSLLMLAYLILAVAALIHTSVKMGRAELRESGVGIILVGIAAAAIPTLIGFVDWAFLYNFSLPGSGYFPLLVAVIPFTMALGVKRTAIEY